MFWSVPTSFRQLGIARLAFRHPADDPVPSPHLHADRVESRPCKSLAADDTLHFSVVVSGPASSDAMCCAHSACFSASSGLYFTPIYFTPKVLLCYLRKLYHLLHCSCLIYVTLVYSVRKQLEECSESYSYILSSPIFLYIQLCSIVSAALLLCNLCYSCVFSLRAAGGMF